MVTCRPSAWIPRVTAAGRGQSTSSGEWCTGSASGSVILLGTVIRGPQSVRYHAHSGNSHRRPPVTSGHSVQSAQSAVTSASADWTENKRDGR